MVLAGQPLREVLIAVDLSSTAERVVRRATLLPMAEETRLELFHVVREGRRTSAAEEALFDERLRRVRAVAEGARGEPLVRVRIGRGMPHEEISRRARAVHASVVVMGRDAPGRLRDRLTRGPTLSRVIRNADAPTLVVAQQPSETYSSAILAVDLSDSSRQVTQLGLQLIEGASAASVSIVHAYHVLFEGWVRERRAEQESREEARSRLDRFRDELGSVANGWRFVLAKGDPRVVVLQEALRQRAELIVVGTHARAGLSRAVAGSVAEWMTSEAPCDVAVTGGLL